jgi:hypothetical protein
MLAGLRAEPLFPKTIEIPSSSGLIFLENKKFSAYIFLMQII